MDRNKVMKGLECCLWGSDWEKMCDECPYEATEEEKRQIDWDCHLDQLRKDALALLKAQEEPLVLCQETLSEDAIALLKEHEAMMQCIKGKCRICPHCSNCDVDEDGLLKEQDAVKPCVAVDTWICPKCGHALESQYLIDDKENPHVLVHEQYNFCPNCGKAVKWE